MLLRNRLREPDILIRAGLACLIAGLLAQQFIHPPTDFWHGFVAGVSGALIGLSIVFNVRGMVLRRQDRDIRS
ncbi:MAG: hypothetical protein MUP13_02100 [Thermoanaerobaculales bacterium]|nr:hypothetical protein [Thermoanaerobaculales bacterium]